MKAAESESCGLLGRGGLFCIRTNTWTSTSTSGAPINRSGYTAVWTGSKMIIWGGHGDNSSNYLNSGGIYDPETNTWTSTSTYGAPTGRYGHTAVWTGSKMIIWGGKNSNYLTSGGIYDPATDSWSAGGTGEVSNPYGGILQSAIWTGIEMIIWGGEVPLNGVGPTKWGVRYIP